MVTKSFRMPIIICLLILLRSVGFAQKVDDSLRIVQLIRADYKALGENDTEAHQRNCSPDYQLLEAGDLWTLQKELEYMRSKKGQPLLRTDTFHFVSVQVKGDMAFAVYDLKSSITRSGATKYYHWMESAVVVRLQDGWKIRLIHSTPVKD